MLALSNLATSSTVIIRSTIEDNHKFAHGNTPISGLSSVILVEQLLKSSNFVICVTKKGWLFVPMLSKVHQTPKLGALACKGRLESNLTIRLQQLSRRVPADTFAPPKFERLLLICDRCHDIEAVVVAIMEAPPQRKPGHYAEFV